jgi:phage gp45-like
MGSPFGAIDKMKGTVYEKDETKLTFSIGRVVDTNDPNQMGRVRVYIPNLDKETSLVGDIPFAMYCSSFAGHNQVQSRGPETDTFTTGPVAYGTFSVPKVGTDVIVACLDGNPQYRVWFGAITGMYLAHTMPHGRFIFNTPGQPTGTLDGPLSSTESPIQPTYDNLTDQFTRTEGVASNDGAVNTTPRINFEWRSRGMDYQAAGLGLRQKNSPTQKISDIADNRGFVFTEEDGKKFKDGNYTQGYAQSRVEPNIPYDPNLVDGGVNLDPQVYSQTTPGFHAFAMDDRPENCRIRLRTSSGHTIIMDDTNERIYISTAEGNAWVEMDQSGNIDIYSARRVSIRAELDVNIVTEGAFRVTAEKGIHLNTTGDFRATAIGNTQINSSGQTNIQSGGDISIQTEGSIQASTGASLNLTSSGSMNLNSSSDAAFSTGGTLNLNAADNILVTASDIQLNGPTAATAVPASPNDAQEAYLANRVPEHEPWGRIMMEQSATDGNNGNTFQLELDYDSPQVGRVELGETIPRNSNWHR